MQAHVNHIAIRIKAGNCDPIPFFDQIMRGDLDTRQERKDGVPKNEQQYCGQCTKPGEQRQWRFTGEQRNAYDDGDQYHQDSCEIEIAFNAYPAEAGAALINFINCRKNRIDRKRSYPEDKK